MPQLFGKLYNRLWYSFGEVIDPKLSALPFFPVEMVLANPDPSKNEDTKLIINTKLKRPFIRSEHP